MKALAQQFLEEIGFEKQLEESKYEYKNPDDERPIKPAIQDFKLPEIK